MDEQKNSTEGNIPMEFSEELHERKLQTARIVTHILNVVGVIAAAGIIGIFKSFFPVMLKIATIGYLGMLVIIVYVSQGFIRFPPRRKSIYPSVFIGFVSVCSGVFLRGVFIHVLSNANVWILFYTIFIILAFAVLYHINETETEKRTLNMFLFLALIAGYSYGSVIIPNRLLDKSVSIRYQAQVMDKHISKGKTRMYYLHLSPWGPQQEKDQVVVSSSFYEETEIGDIVMVNYRQGYFGIPWFYVQDK